jgi:ATP-dependent DNA helicase RecG
VTSDADVEVVARSICAFANDWSNLGGGYVICGARETKDELGFPRVERVGLSAAQIAEIEAKVLRYCREYITPPVVPLVDTIAIEGEQRRLLIFAVNATPHAHMYGRDKSPGSYWVRVSSQTIEARNGILRELLVRKAVLEPFDQRVCVEASIEDLDIFLLRDGLRDLGLLSNGRPVEYYLSDQVPLSTFVPALCGKQPLTGKLCPRNFALLLFGKEPQRWVPGAVSYFSVYPDVDRGTRFSERHDLAGTLIEQHRKLWSLLKSQIKWSFDKGGVADPNIYNYPERALEEALGNALAHRNYEVPHPTRYTVFSDRIEIDTPGGLSSALDRKAFQQGEAPARWRNQCLAWFFQRLEIGQGEGQGIRAMFRAMEENGNPPPEFQVSSESVICKLPTHPREAVTIEFERVESALARGSASVAREALFAILEGDPANERALRLLLGVIDARHRDRLSEILSAAGEALDKLPPSLLLNLAKALDELDQVTLLGLFRSAASRAVEEQVIVESMYGLLQIGNASLAEDLINSAIRKAPDLADQPAINRVQAEIAWYLARQVSVYGNLMPAIQMARKAIAHLEYAIQHEARPLEADQQLLHQMRQTLEAWNSPF